MRWNASVTEGTDARLYFSAYIHGFCSLEAGLVRTKNSVNVAMKKLLDFMIALKEEINLLAGKTGEPAPYDLGFWENEEFLVNK